jgi:cell division protein FtsL
MVQARQRQVEQTAGHESLWTWLGLGERRSGMFLLLLLCLLASGLGVVKTTHENRYVFNRLQELKNEANELSVEWGQLLIEQSTFGVEGRIEQKAIDQLGMRVPDVSQIVMVGQ